MKKQILAVLAAILLFLLPVYAEENLPGISGGWQATADTAVTEDVRAVFDKAVKGHDGASWEPVGLLSTQVVAGTNYCFLCRNTQTIPELERSYEFVYIYEDPQGNAKILEVKDIEFGLSPLPEEENAEGKSDDKEKNSIGIQVALAEEKSSNLLEELESGCLPQQTMNRTSYELFHIWDDALNNIWTWLTEHLDKESMSALTEEEIQWIQNKDADVKAEGAEWNGGSMQPCIENNTAYRWTRERVYELEKRYGQ